MNRLFKCVVVGLLAALLSYFVDALWPQSCVDDLSIGILAGVLFWYELKRRRVIANVNHHVRNALMVLMHSPDKEVRAQAFRRIEWAMRSSLGGKEEEWEEERERDHGETES